MSCMACEHAMSLNSGDTLAHLKCSRYHINSALSCTKIMVLHHFGFLEIKFKCPSARYVGGFPHFPARNDRFGDG